MPHRHKVKVTILGKPSSGWWMVMAEDEQGYAPAAHLEPMEEGSPYDHLATADDASGREERGSKYWGLEGGVRTGQRGERG